MQAVEAELKVFLERYKNLVDLLGRRAVVRNGYLLARKIMTGIGPVEIRVVREWEYICNFLRPLGPLGEGPPGST